MKRFLIPIGCALAIVLATDVAQAQGKGGGAKPKLSTGGAAKGGGAKSHASAPKSSHAGGAAKTTTAKATGPKSKATTTKTAKTTDATSKSMKTAKATDTKSKSTKTAKASKTTTTAKSDKKTATTTTPTTEPVTLTKVQQKLQKNTNLASKLESRLPKGTDPMTAAEGFRNLGQFVAAVNVSNNLGLDFDRLKTAMVDDGMSLGQAIKDQRTSVDSTTEASRAQRDADTLIRSTEMTAASSTSTNTAKARKTKDGRP